MGRKGVFKSESGKSEVLAHYSKLIKGIQVSYQERYVDTSYGKTFMIETGQPSKPKIFLFHGSCSNSAMWFSDLKFLSEAFHCFAVDILGEAGKSDENRLNLQSDDHAKWIDELLNGLKVEGGHFIGNSFGGWMALKYATTFPKRVKSLSLIATSGITNTKFSFLMKSIVYSFMGEKGVQKLNAYIFGSDEIPQIAVETINLIFRNFNPMMGALPIYKDEALRNLSMPVLYIAGENDVTVDVEKTADRLKKTLKNPEIRIIRNNGHVLYNLTQEIVPFIKSHTGEDT